MMFDKIGMVVRRSTTLVTWLSAFKSSPRSISRRMSVLSLFRRARVEWRPKHAAASRAREWLARKAAHDRNRPRARIRTERSPLFKQRCMQLANNRRGTPILWALDGKAGTPGGWNAGLTSHQAARGDAAVSD